MKLTNGHRSVKILVIIFSTISFCIFTYYRTMALENADNISVNRVENFSNVNKKDNNISNVGIKENNNLNNVKISKNDTDNYKTGEDNNVSEASSKQTVSFIMPANGRISSFFGYRKVKLNDGTIEAGAHKGIDIAVPLGTKIGAAMDGVVEFVGMQNGYGNVIILKHSDVLETVYAHCSRIEVNKGDKVNTGEEIGKAGSTGRSTGPHIHFEVRFNGNAVDPLKYLNPNIVSK